MKIALTGPSELTEYDKKDIEKYIDAIVKEHEVSILAYRSIEIEVFKYFVNHSNLASSLTIHTFQHLDELPETLRKPIRFLISKGAKYRSFNHDEVLVKRTSYITAWQNIIDSADLVVSFYDNKKTTLMIPIDEAKAKNKKGLVYYLPGSNIDKFEQSPDKKIKFVN